MDAEFRVIDPDTGKPRAKGTEDWTDDEYRRWKRLPWIARYRLIFPPIGWLTIALAAVGIVAAIVRTPAG
jgi:hypothetical protein